MKRFLLLLAFIICTITINASKYLIKYRVNDQHPISFVLNVSSNYVTLKGHIFGIRQLGTITSHGLTYNSYAIGSKQKMFCIAQRKIDFKINNNTYINGYIIIIGQTMYLADKIG